MEVSVGRPAGWMKALTGRSPMKSPGAPSHRSEVERLFWDEIARGLTSEHAAAAVGGRRGVVPAAWRDVTVRARLDGPLSVVRRAGRNRAVERAAHWRAADRSR